MQMAAVPEEIILAPPLPARLRRRKRPRRPRPTPRPLQDDPRRMESLRGFVFFTALLSTARTHFEVLGLERASTEAMVKEAYFRLARRFHPDVHHDPALADLRDKIEAIFVRLAEAYEVLRNPRIRAKYENQITPGEGAAALPSAAPAVPIDPRRRRVRAAASIKRAARLLTSEMYWDAIQVLEPAVVRAQGKPRQEGRVLLARAYMKNVNWLKQGEELLLEVLKEDTNHAEAYLLLAQIYRDQGLKARAAHMLRRPRSSCPTTTTSAPSWRSSPITSRETAAGRSGLLKRLFTRG